MAQDKPCLRRCGKGIELWCAGSPTHTGIRESFGLMWFTHMQACIYMCIIHTCTHTQREKNKSGREIWTRAHLQWMPWGPRSGRDKANQLDPLPLSGGPSSIPPSPGHLASRKVRTNFPCFSPGLGKGKWWRQGTQLLLTVRDKPSLWGWVCSAGLEDWPCPATFKAAGQILSLGEGGPRGSFVIAGKCRVCLGLPVSHRKSYQKKDLGAHPTQELKTLV